MRDEYGEITNAISHKTEFGEYRFQVIERIVEIYTRGELAPVRIPLNWFAAETRRSRDGAKVAVYANARITTPLYRSVTGVFENPGRVYEVTREQEATLRNFFTRVGEKFRRKVLE
ncbi:hypothetical protein [Actinorhabdospora filicis]|nr:hypothetical protein [Actinorhabdospora filicis]